MRGERLVAAAAEAGADAVKVQTFTPEEICADVPSLFGHDASQTPGLPDGRNTDAGTLSKGGFPRQWHAKLKQYAERMG